MKCKLSHLNEKTKMEVGSSGGMLILKLEKDFAKDSI
jgi:hypothetical protein